MQRLWWLNLIRGIITLFVGILSKLLAGGWAFIGGMALVVHAFQMRKALMRNLSD